MSVPVGGLDVLRLFVVLGRDVDVVVVGMAFVEVEDKPTAFSRIDTKEFENGKLKKKRYKSYI